jgi:hypothetical protein
MQANGISIRAKGKRNKLLKLTQNACKVKATIGPGGEEGLGKCKST